MLPKMLNERACCIFVRCWNGARAASCAAAGASAARHAKPDDRRTAKLSFARGAFGAC